MEENISGINENGKTELLNLSLDSMFLFDRAGIILEANSIGAKRFGANAVADVLGKRIFDFMPPDVAEKRENLWAKLECTKEPELLLDERDGRYYESIISPHFDGQGNLLRASIVSRDVTDRKALETAEVVIRAKSDFLISMSHELMTPLNAVIGFGQILDQDFDESLSKDQAEYVRHILDGGQKLHDLVKKNLSYSEIMDGKIHIIPRDVDTREMAEECLELARTDADNHEIKLILDAPDDDLQTIWIDPMRGKEILSAFLSNAILYNQVGGEVRVGISLENDNWLRISISDTGNGIPTEKQDGVFMPFNRIDMANSSISGTGVGLAIAKGLSETMGGRIGFESEEGKGSVFWVEFPRAHQE